MIRRIIQYIVSLGIGVLFLWYTFRQIDLQAIWSVMDSVSWLYLILAGLTSICSHVTRSLRWRLLITPLKASLNLGAVFAALMIGYAVNLVLPRGGELARVVSLNREEDTPVSGVIATVVVERVLDALAMAILLAFSLLWFADILSGVYPGIEVLGIILLTGCLALLAGLIAASLFRETVIAFLNTRCSRYSPAVTGKIISLLDTFLKGISSLHSPAQIGGLILWSTATWALYIIAMWLLLVAFDFPSIYHISLTGSILLLAMTGVGVSIPIPGAVGTYHFLCMQTLVTAFAIPQSEAVAFATISHAVNFIVLNGIGGVICWLLQRIGFLRGSATRGAESAIQI